MDSKTGQLHNGNENQKEVYALEARKITFSIPERVLVDITKERIVKELTERIKELEKNDEESTISDSAAEEVIRDKLNNWKKKNVKEIDAIDVYSITRLPIEQIGRILFKLEKEGVVKEDDGN